MFFAEAQIRVHLYGKPADMRKSYDGLQALARHAMDQNPLDGSLYVFEPYGATSALEQIKAMYAVEERIREQKLLGAKHVGIIQSLIVTCRLHGVDPYTYLVDVLQCISLHRASRVADLTPRLWESLFADKPLHSDLQGLTA